MGELDSSLGLAAKALSLYAKRSDVLATNLANADTPNYRARDIDFRRALGQEQSRRQVLDTVVSRPGHMTLGGETGTAALRYRAATQSSLDGNSVDAATERGEFAANAVRYQAALRFVDGRVKSILAAVRGD
ncbi:MAG: flagellar basal body rod protein FlgB [Pseudomonadota bacterium]|nr:flagellar basal body rod protein FlgB [Pseudomonadota bacterium]